MDQRRTVRTAMIAIVFVIFIAALIFFLRWWIAGFTAEDVGYVGMTTLNSVLLATCWPPGLAVAAS